MTHIQTFALLGSLLFAVVSLSQGDFGRLARHLMVVGAFTVSWNGVRVLSISMSDVFFVLATVAAIASPLRPRPLSAILGSSQRYLVVYGTLLIVGGFLGGILRGMPDIGLATGLRFGIAILVAIFLVSALAAQRDWWQRFAIAYAIGAAVSGVVALTGGGSVAGRPLGLSTWPNHLGLSMMLAMFLAIATQGSAGRKVRWLVVASIPICLVALVESGSRGALIGASTGLAVLTTMYRHRGVPILVLASLAAIPSILFAATWATTSNSAVGRTLAPGRGEQASSAGRTAFYEEAWELIQANPILGEGFAQGLKFESVPIQIVVIGGVFGIFALVTLGIMACSICRYAYGQRAGILERSSAAGVLGAATFLLTSNVLFDRYLIFFLSMACMACSSQLLPLSEAGRCPPGGRTSSTPTEGSPQHDLHGRLRPKSTTPPTNWQCSMRSLRLRLL